MSHWALGVRSCQYAEIENLDFGSGMALRLGLRLLLRLRLGLRLRSFCATSHANNQGSKPLHDEYPKEPWLLWPETLRVTHETGSRSLADKILAYQAYKGCLFASNDKKHVIWELWYPLRVGILKLEGRIIGRSRVGIMMESAWKLVWREWTAECERWAVQISGSNVPEVIWKWILKQTE